MMCHCVQVIRSTAPYAWLAFRRSILNASRIGMPNINVRLVATPAHVGQRSQRGMDGSRIASDEMATQRYNGLSVRF